MFSHLNGWLRLLGLIGYTDEELDQLEIIDDEMYEFFREEKQRHDKGLEKILPRNNAEAILLFPEYKAPIEKRKSSKVITREEIEQAESVNIQEVIRQYVKLKNLGSHRAVGICPFHSEKTPSFTVYKQTNSFYCFGCQKGGNVINFLQDMNGLTFQEAVRALIRFSKN